MTQRHIIRASGIGWARRAWTRLHEPRIISAAYGVSYLIAAAVGAWTTVAPPQSIEGESGPWLMGMITLSITAGGLLGIVTVATGRWWVERFATWLIIGGLAFWGAMTIYLQVDGSGNRGLTIMAALLSVGWYWIRHAWISDRPFSPRHHPASVDETDR